MEANTADSTESRFRSGSKLHKDPPASLSSRYSLKKPQSNSSLRRHPSAPIYPRSQDPSSASRDHHRSRSNAYGSSNSSSEQVGAAGTSPALSGPEVGTSSAAYLNQPNRSSTHRYSIQEEQQDDLVGPPFDARAVINTIDPSKAANYPASLRRPPPPSLTHTSPDPRGLRFLRQSQSFNRNDRAMEITPPRSDNSGTISPKRLSDETGGGKFPPPLRKRTGFSNFVNSMLGSPRTIKISAPENPVHMIHVGYDNQTGQFTVSIV